MYIAAIFRHPSLTIVFRRVAEMSQSQAIQTGVCFVSLLWKCAASSKGHASGL